MITKILFTALIVLAALAFVRHKNSRGRAQAEIARQAAEDRRNAMFIAVALVALTLLISGALYYQHWQETHKVVTVHVINSHSGETQRYHAYEGDVDGRRFRTVEGRLISLSDAERMEVVEGGDAPRP